MTAETSEGLKEIRIYFYRPAIDKHFLDNAISAITLIRTFPGLLWRREWMILRILWLLRAAHAEIEDYEQKMIYTSTMRYGDSDGGQKANGLVKRPSAGVLKNPKRWYYYRIFVHEDVYKAAFEMLDIFVANNKGYDRRLIAKFLTGPIGRKLIEEMTGKPLDSITKFICSGFTELGAYTAVYGEYIKYGQYAELLNCLLALKIKNKSDEPDPLNLSIAFKRAGLVPYRQVDHKPLCK